jgi:hypothetical protein
VRLCVQRHGITDFPSRTGKHLDPSKTIESAKKLNIRGIERDPKEERTPRPSFRWPHFLPIARSISKRQQISSHSSRSLSSRPQQNHRCSALINTLSVSQAAAPAAAHTHSVHHTSAPGAASRHHSAGHSIPGSLLHRQLRRSTRYCYRTRWCLWWCCTVVLARRCKVERCC